MNSIVGGCPYGFVQGKPGCDGSACRGQHGAVADLLWDDVKCFFDLDLMGRCRTCVSRMPRWRTGSRSSTRSRRRAGSASTPRETWRFRCLGRRLCRPARRMPSALSCGSGHLPMCWRQIAAAVKVSVGVVHKTLNPAAAPVDS